MSTRPRVSFDDRGFCNACQWSESKKKNIDWEERKNLLRSVLNDYRSKSDSGFDCVVPVSGGKDGSYISHTLREEYDIKPLCVTVKPPLPLEIGEKNLQNFIESGFGHISISPEYEVMRKLNKAGFIEMGLPYFGWLTAIECVPSRIAEMFNISLVVYSEDGEVEYGGSTETNRSYIYSSEYQKRVYLEGGYNKVIKSSGINNRDLFFFSFSDKSSQSVNNIHWSYFEDWDPYRNYLVAKEFCGLIEAEASNSGTFTNFAQNDQALYALHTYIMYLKFGFGRANQDACIEIRRGAMDRTQALNLVRLYDGIYPSEHIEEYLDYFEMSKKEFDRTLARWTNKDLFELDGSGNIKPKFVIN